MPPPAITIAVDGPAAAGKGTLARRLAAALGYACLDTGLIYRAVAWAVLRAGGDPADDAAATRAAESLNLAVLDDPAVVAELRSDQIGQAASQVAAVAAVRRAVLPLQRTFARRPPGGQPGAVLDGRDIGTTVCPDAEIKIFVTASLDARAGRRHQELLSRGVKSIYGRVLEDMERRDALDRGRAVSPLIPATDAWQLDTTALDADQTFQRALAYIRDHLAARHGQRVSGPRATD
ncbi:MAG: (d)CMP kinase [Alphaproteobacteria bacterium]